MPRYHQHPDRFRRHQHRKGDKIFFGLAIALAGLFLMLRKLHMLPYFDWQTFWPFILIGMGLFIGIKKRFHNHAWWILILIGSANLIPEFTIHGTSSTALVVPAALIIGGLLMIFRSKNRNAYLDKMEIVTNAEDTLNIDVTFGGRKEIVTSQNFRGGTISTTFGGTEINMVQANCTMPVVLNLKVSFGGVELIVPSHWELQNDIQPTFGSVEDHRSIRTVPPANEEKKILILKGNCSFGSIEIKSY